MARLGNGLIITEQLTQRNVKVDLHFQPSVGILARKVEKFGLDIRSFREPLRRAVQRVIIPSIRTNFDSGGRPAWPELAAGTISQKNGNSSPLIRTGALRRTMGYLNIWNIDSEKAMITDLPQSVWYGKVHQAGHGGVTTTFVRNVSSGAMTAITEGAEGGIPARPFVMVQPEDIDNIERVFDEWLAEKMLRAGLGTGR